MESQPGEELTPTETGTLKEKEEDRQQAIDDIHIPREDEGDILRAKALESHQKQELSQTEAELQQAESPIENSRQEILKQLRAERRASEPLVVRNPRNKIR